MVGILKGEVTLRLIGCWVLVHFCVCEAGQINKKTTTGGGQNWGRWQGLGAAFCEWPLVCARNRCCHREVPGPEVWGGYLKPGH